MSEVKFIISVENLFIALPTQPPGFGRPSRERGAGPQEAGWKNSQGSTRAAGRLALMISMWKCALNTRSFQF